MINSRVTTYPHHARLLFLALFHSFVAVETIGSSLNQVLVHVDEVFVQLFGLLFGVFFIVLRLCDSILSSPGIFFAIEPSPIEKTLFVFRRCIDSEFEARWQSSSKKLSMSGHDRFVASLAVLVAGGSVAAVAVPRGCFADVFLPQQFRRKNGCFSQFDVWTFRL